MTNQQIQLDEAEIILGSALNSFKLMRFWMVLPKDYKTPEWVQQAEKYFASKIQLAKEMDEFLYHPIVPEKTIYDDNRWYVFPCQKEPVYIPHGSYPIPPCKGPYTWIGAKQEIKKANESTGDK